MKINIILYFILAGLVSPFYSCNVVDLTPVSSLTEANFYKTADDMDRAVLGIYSRYQSRMPRDWTLFEMPSDHLYMSTYRFIGGLEALNNLDFQPQNDILRNFWQNTYNGVFRANAVLTYLDNPTDYGQNEKEQYGGEARFMRALLYFDLVRTFGGVPKVTELLTVDETKNVVRSSKEEVYDLIEEDLKNAIEMLPERSDIARGRASKEAAVALLGKVYVYLEDWTQAKSYLEEVLTYDFQLMENFGDLWEEEHEDNVEVIFAMKYIANDNGHLLSRDFLPYFGVEGVSSSAGGEVALPAWSIMKKYEEADSRKEATFTEYWKAPGSSDSEEWRPYVSKFLSQNASASGLDLPVLRLADILLLRSEACYRLGELDQALESLNAVRSRAFKGESHNYSRSDILDPEGYLEKLLLERQLELAYENQRWMDLVRTGKLQETMSEVEWSFNPSTGMAQEVELNPQPQHELFPIPQHEIDQSDPGVITQNDGY